MIQKEKGVEYMFVKPRRGHPTYLDLSSESDIRRCMLYVERTIAIYDDHLF
jgi:hypothetical protein